MKIPQLDLQAQYRTIEAAIDRAVKGVLESGHFILGPNVVALEQEVAAYLGVKHAVGVASGTDALVLALRALDIGPGDEVIVPTYTFFATAEAVMMVGATPVFVDIEPITYGIDVAQAAARITPQTRAMVPVHLYGHPADMNPILDLARTHRLRIIEDNAQAFGAEYHGRKTGTFGDAGCLSFFPSKNLGAYGDGGMVVTDDAAIAERVRMLRTHGWRRKYQPETLGYNSRLDELQAAILRVKLPYVDRWNDGRRELAGLYDRELARHGIGVPVEAASCRHVYHQYMIRVSERDRIQRDLTAAGISTALYYPAPLHRLQPCAHLCRPGDAFPVADAATAETLAIPFYPEMTADQRQRVIDALAHAVGAREMPV
jgi:dTDP-4-amino-4,6-dideoxygalactose transaminase